MYKKLFYAALFVCIYSAAAAQNYVTIFEDCNFSGRNRLLGPGMYKLDDMKIGNDKLSSMQIPRGMKITIYEDNNFRGRSNTYYDNVSCLEGAWNDMASSVVVEYSNSRPENDHPNTSYPSGRNGNYVTIYSDCSYRGNSLRLEPGNYGGDKLGLLKYEISSIEIPAGLRATVYVGNEYMHGTSYTLTENSSCLNSSMNNRIGSLVIDETYDNNSNQHYGRERVMIYTNAGYDGQSASLRPGMYSTMAEAGFPDNALSSITVPDGYRVVLYEYENFTGRSLTVTESRSSFSMSRWNDRASSIAVYRDR